jgi:hypothetical protein
MTETGRRIFVNAVVWMKKFDGKAAAGGSRRCSLAGWCGTT